MFCQILFIHYIQAVSDLEIEEPAELYVLHELQKISYRHLKKRTFRDRNAVRVKILPEQI